MTKSEQLRDYYNQLKTPFQKICRLRFLNPDGSVAFIVDNDPKNKLNKYFISNGSITVNLQNGQRRSASVVLSNIDEHFDYNVNALWYGTEIALDEGLILSDGTEFYLPQGVFVIDTPTENVKPSERTMEYNLVDKWSNLNGSLYGNLDGTYEVPVGTNIFSPITALLAEDKGNGHPVDRVSPIFTDYYNNMTQSLPDGSTANMVNSPYTLTVDGENGTIADVILGLVAMVNGWVGYDSTGALRVDASQDDILDSTKPVQWTFSQEETQLLGMTYQIKNTEVYNDYIVVGERLDDNSQPKGRAQNLDPNSDTNINIIGRKTLRVSQAGFGTDQMCKDFAEWKLKRSSVLQKAVTISCTQMFHLQENTLVELIRTDKQGSPSEKHLIQGFSRPLTGEEPMTINAISVNDFVRATVS